jgi:hypothetical protein
VLPPMQLDQAKCSLSRWMSPGFGHLRFRAGMTPKSWKTLVSAPEPEVTKSVDVQVWLTSLQLDQTKRSLSRWMTPGFGHLRFRAGMPPKSGKSPVSTPEPEVAKSPGAQVFLPSLQLDQAKCSLSRWKTPGFGHLPFQGRYDPKIGKTYIYDKSRILHIRAPDHIMVFTP